MIWDFADERIPDRLLLDLERLAADIPDELGRLLADDERLAMLDRIARLVHTATFPEPLGDRPPYPVAPGVNDLSGPTTKVGPGDHCGAQMVGAIPSPAGLASGWLRACTNSEA